MHEPKHRGDTATCYYKILQNVYIKLHTDKIKKPEIGMLLVPIGYKELALAGLVSSPAVIVIHQSSAVQVQCVGLCGFPFNPDTPESFNW